VQQKEPNWGQQLGYLLVMNWAQESDQALVQESVMKMG
jgi:hypothetical protein